MKKIKTSVCAVLASLAIVGLSSCSVVSTGAGIGALYSGVTEGMTATSNTVGIKVGTSNAIGVLGLVAVGDASITKAAKEGGITKISHVDIQKTSVLGLFASYKTMVYGE